ncbi:translation initiation factor 2 [Phyllobacterium sp. K27]
MKRTLAAIAIISILPGCASIARGTTEDVVIITSPSDAKITTSIGSSCTSSPCTLKVSRKTPFTATAKKPGYHTSSLFIDTKMSGKGTAGIAGNVLFGGVIGVGVDAVSGATLDHTPNPATITLVPIKTKKPTVKRPKHSGKPTS